MRRSWRRRNEADRPVPFRRESWRRSKANQSNPVLPANDIPKFLCPKLSRRLKARAGGGSPRAWQTGPDSAAGGFDFHTWVFDCALALTRCAAQFTTLRIDALGNT